MASAPRRSSSVTGIGGNGCMVVIPRCTHWPNRRLGSIEIPRRPENSSMCTGEQRQAQAFEPGRAVTISIPVGITISILAGSPLVVKATLEILETRVGQDHLERHDDEPVVPSPGEHRRVVVHNARKRIAVFQSFRQFPEWDAGRVGVEAVDRRTPIRRDTRMAGEPEAVESSGPQAEAVLLLVEFPLDPCPGHPGTVAAKEHHLDGFTTRHGAVHRQASFRGSSPRPNRRGPLSESEGWSSAAHASPQLSARDHGDGFNTPESW